MAEVTSKLQVTIPKAIADRYGIKPGDEIQFQAAGTAIRVTPPSHRTRMLLSLAERVRLFEQMMADHEAWLKDKPWPRPPSEDRGWTREELYTRGEPR